MVDSVTNPHSGSWASKRIENVSVLVRWSGEARGGTEDVHGRLHGQYG